MQALVPLERLEGVDDRSRTRIRASAAVAQTRAGMTG